MTAMPPFPPPSGSTRARDLVVTGAQITQKRVANTNHFSRRSPRRKKKGGAGKVAKASSPSTTPSPSTATASTASSTPAGLRKPAAATTTPITKANRERAGVLAEDLESPLLVLRAATRKAQEQNSASGQQEP